MPEVLDNKQEAALLIESEDKDKDGRLALEEIIASWFPPQPDRADHEALAVVKECFAESDRDKDGKLTVEELEQLLDCEDKRDEEL